MKSFLVTAEDGVQHLIQVSGIEQASAIAGADDASLAHHLIFKTSTGEPVNRLNKGTYEILTHFGSVRASSEDPDAP